MSKFKTNKTSSPANRRTGISILEAMITIALLMIGILALTKIFPLTLKISQTAEEATIAANLAQAKIEELFSAGYDNINTGTIEARHHLAGSPDNPFYKYERQTEVDYVDGNLATSISATGLKRIKVTVYWRSRILNSEKNVLTQLLMVQK